MRDTTIILLAAWLCGLVLFPGIGKAEENPADAVRLDTVTVTAEKREADAQQVAIPMTVFTSIDIEDRGIDALADVAQLVPNLQFLTSMRPSGGSFNYRGLGMFGMSVLSEKSPVVVYYDGIPWEGRFGIATDFGNIDHMEFLRGPQGTLYGKNAMAGVLNIVTQEPGSKPTGRISSFAEDHDTYGARFQVQTPVVEDRWSLLLSGALDTTNGYMTDHTEGGERHWDKQETQHVFLKNVFSPNEDFRAVLQYGFDNSDSGSGATVVGRDLSYDIETGFTDPEFQSRTHNAALKMDYEASLFNISSISTFRAMHAESYQYFGYATSAGFDDIDEHAFTQEVRLTSPGQENPNRFSWLAGAFLSIEEQKRGNTGYSYDMTAYDMGNIRYDYPTTIDSNSASVFGEINIPLFIEGLSATLGARYEYVDTEMDHRYELTDLDSGDYIEDPSEYEIEDSWDNLLGKVALEYQYDNDLMFYASAAQGYSPGGFNYLETNEKYATFNEQKSLDYELGMKSMLLDRKLMLNPNFFYTEYEDLQISEEVESMKFIVVNAGKAHAYGFELDFRAIPLKALTIHGSLGVIQAKYDDYKENMGYGNFDYSDNTIVNTPSYTMNLGCTYRHENGLFAMVDYRRFGETYFSKDNSDHFKRDAFNLVNAKIGWESETGFEIYAYGRNIFDEEYFTEVGEEYDLFLVGEPRTLGIQVGYRF